MRCHFLSLWKDTHLSGKRTMSKTLARVAMTNGLKKAGAPRRSAVGPASHREEKRRQSASESASSSGSGSEEDGSEDEDDEDEDDEQDKEDALRALEAHFASSFGAVKAPAPASSRPSSSAAKPKLATKGKEKAREAGLLDAISTSSSSTSTTIPAPKPDAKLPPRSKPAAKAREPETIVFGQPTASSSSSSSNPISPSPDAAGGDESRKGWRSFMSAKVDMPHREKSSETLYGRRARAAAKEAQRKAKADAGEGGGDGEGAAAGGGEEAEEEKAMQSNDRELSRLLSTTLFAPGGASTGAQGTRRNLSSNETLARLMELSSSSAARRGAAVGRGWGESAHKAAQMGKMPASMRAGLRRAQKDKLDKDVERAKELGNYHSSVKKLVGNNQAGMDLILGTRDDDRKKRTRERGLGMGVGTFNRGTLRLSEEEVERINGSRKRGPSGGSGGSGGGKKGGKSSKKRKH